MYIPTNIKIILFRSDKNLQGLSPIYLQFIQNRKANRISLRKWISEDAWINDGNSFVKEKGSDAPANAKMLNMFLRSQLDRAGGILLEFEKNNQPISFSQFKDKFVNQNDQNFITFCETELSNRSKSGKYSRETLRSNWSKLNKIKGFRSEIKFFDLDLSFLEAYENHMRVNLGNDTNTIFSAMKFVRTMLNAARKQGLTEVYPFDNYKLVYKKDTRARLTSEELEILQNLYNNDTLSATLQNVLQYFLFACYTGLTWKDLESLDYSEIENRGNIYLISKRRHKTDSHFVVPLIEQARGMIILSQKEGRVFPNIYTNQKSNLYLKKIIESTKIKKHITFHVARHTFGTVALNNGIPREVVQKMLGHATPHQTDLYSKVLDNYVISEMKKWKKTSVQASDYKKHLSNETLKGYKKLLTQVVASRITSGLSEQDVASKIGMTKNQYQKIEKGEMQLGVADLIEIIRHLEINLSEII